MPYAKSVRSEKALHGAKPDPSLLFDCQWRVSVIHHSQPDADLVIVLMARPDGKFAQNPAGISSMLFYHATIIIHGIFTNIGHEDLVVDCSRHFPNKP